MQPKVSMVVPCYNKAPWIGAMLDSVMAQLWDNIEVILVNDGSTDGTREVIAAYEPRFLERGYQVVIVDQENQGVAAAVRNGLMRITGEYVCMPDSDDALDPEYVSAMAGWLERHEDDQWVVCDSNETCFDKESQPFLKRDATPIENDKYTLKQPESFILQRTAQSICRLMVRASYLIYCRVLEDFPVEPRVTQEPQIFIPLALGGAQPVQMGRVLYYRYKREGSILLSSVSSYDAGRDHILKYSELINKTVLCKATDIGLMEFPLSIGKTISEHLQACTYPGYDESVLTRQLVDTINSGGQCGGSIDMFTAQTSGLFALLRHFSNKLIGYDPRRVAIDINAKGRVIAYAAFGNSSCSVRRGLINSKIRPDVFWDTAAKDGDCVDGIPVVKPAFDTLNEYDTVLLLLQNNGIARAVDEQFQHTPARGNIWYFFDVANYLVEQFYGTNKVS